MAGVDSLDTMEVGVFVDPRIDIKLSLRCGMKENSMPASNTTASPKYSHLILLFSGFGARFDATFSILTALFTEEVLAEFCCAP